MNEDLGVWTNEDSALVLIDYQPDQFESIRSETPGDLIELNTRWLASAAKAFDVPIVLSTIGVDAGTNGPTLPAIADELEGIEPIDRTSTNSFESDAFREAVAATGRKRLIFGALQTEQSPKLSRQTTNLAPRERESSINGSIPTARWIWSKPA